MPYRQWYSVLNGSVYTNAFFQCHALLRWCLSEADSQLWGTVNVLTPAPQRHGGQGNLIQPQLFIMILDWDLLLGLQKVRVKFSSHAWNPLAYRSFTLLQISCGLMGVKSLLPTGLHLNPTIMVLEENNVQRWRHYVIGMITGVSNSKLGFVKDTKVNPSALCNMCTCTFPSVYRGTKFSENS